MMALSLLLGWLALAAAVAGPAAVAMGTRGPSGQRDPNRASAATASGSRDSPPYPVPTAHPPFSFDHVAVFAHVTKATPFNASELAFLSNCSIVQFDKGQLSASMPGAAFEERAAASARQVQAAAAAQGRRPWLLFYLNLLINFDIFHNLYNATTADPSRYLLFNSTGAPVHVLAGMGAFDHSKRAMRELFVADCKQAVSPGPFDGCFIDRANYAARVVSEGGHAQPWAHWDLATATASRAACRITLANLTQALGSTHIVLAKESMMTPADLDFPYANAAMPTDTFCSNYNTQADYNKTACLEDILAIQGYAARGQLTESHGMGPLDDADQRRFTFACFLVGMGRLSYFSYASEAKGLAWNIEGTRWWPEYDQPLGEPQGLAERSGWGFRRRFASGTSVTVDLEAHTSTIAWAD